MIKINSLRNCSEKNKYSFLKMIEAVKNNIKHNKIMSE